MVVEWKIRAVVPETPFQCADLISYFAEPSS
jgi:hypothetical protein